MHSITDIINWISFDVTLEDFSNLAQVIIAIVNICLVFYIFVYQKKKDYKDALLHEQNIRLQWFKELLVQPHLSTIYKYYENISVFSEAMKNTNITYNIRSEIAKSYKIEQYNLALTFVELLISIDNKMYIDLMNNLNSLTNGLTENVFNENFDFRDSVVYEENIQAVITKSKNEFIAKIFNYKGISF